MTSGHIAFAFAALIWIAVAACSCESEAQAPPEIDAIDQLYLSRGWVAEVGWLADKDHATIAHIVKRRWQRKRDNGAPHLRYRDAVKAYCAGWDPRTVQTARLRWVKNLDGAEAPPGWPEAKAKWSRHLPWWRAIRKRAASFAAGKLRDPSRGRAEHWGSCDERLPDIKRGRRMVEAGKWVRLDVPGTNGRTCYWGVSRGQS